MLQRLKCKQGSLILEERASSSRGSSRASSRPMSKDASRPGTAAGQLVDKLDAVGEGKEAKDGEISEFVKQFGFNEIVDLEDGEGGGLEDIEAVGQRIYRKGVKILPFEQREGEGPPNRIYYVITAYLDDADGPPPPSRPSSTEASKGRFDSYGLKNYVDKRRYRISLYDPNTSKHVGVTDVTNAPCKQPCVYSFVRAHTGTNTQRETSRP